MADHGRRAARGLVLLALLGGCAERPTAVTLQQARAQRIGAGGFLALDLLATRDGAAIPCDDGSFEVTVAVSGEGPDGHFTELPPQSFLVSCDDGRTGDLSLVVDNSGSEVGYLDWLADAAGTMAEEALDRGGRASLVRVSTVAELVQPLTTRVEQIREALDGMFISNGWTALWDGVRLGHETLGGTLGPSPDRTAIHEFCHGERPLGVVAFTDGADNNSADEQADLYDAERYPGDGIPTTLEDLRGLRVGEATTPVYTIGLGNEVDHVALAELADSTGGRYRAIDRVDQIPDVFSIIQSYFDATHEVCVELPELECGELVVRVGWSWTPPEGGDPVTGTVEDTVRYGCHAASEGRVATILLTLGDPGIPQELSAQLALQAVEWASPRLRPHVLIVLDDGHNGEDVTDVELVQWLLADVDTLTVSYLPEPADGLQPEDVAGFDVVWFANPGYPMDDLGTFETLETYVAAGGGLVLQGDDMTWSKGKAFPTTSLTGLEHGDNGTSACGQAIDNGRGGTYTVTVLDVDHAVTRGLTGRTFLYGNDIDRSTLVGERMQVLATAVPTDAPGCAPRPVVVGYNR
ncbi:MAG: VWA domain-containing protein [Alphaproteobacteria bacterium]|nr:VWA domain-containing protein [Alphaproteobacteria bacterium]